VPSLGYVRRLFPLPIYCVDFFSTVGKIELVKDVIVRLAKTLDNAADLDRGYFRWTPLPVSEYTKDPGVISVRIDQSRKILYMLIGSGFCSSQVDLQEPIILICSMKARERTHREPHTSTVGSSLILT
jgi:hypothetical protein